VDKRLIRKVKVFLTRNRGETKLAQLTLPKVGNRKQYMEQLATMMSHQDVDDDEPAHVGKRTELKTYIIESNSQIRANFTSGKVEGHVEDTGVEKVKILQLKAHDRLSSFYLDKTDDRFWLLHTHGLAEDVDDMVDHLTSIRSYKLDSAWFSSGMLRQISKATGNTFEGAGIDYEPVFDKDNEYARQEELKISIFGHTGADALLARVSDDDWVKHRFAYKRVRINRGNSERFARDDFNYNGRFSVKSGKSIDDHMDLVDSAKSLYRSEMKFIEDYSLGARKSGEVALIEGKPFEFHLEKSINDWDRFFKTFLNSAYPFRLWGIKRPIKEGYYQILGVDLHTGHSLDLEIAKNLVRVYLPKGSCGNVVLRLFVNLQHYVDSRIACDEISFDGVNA
jgi:hypothetical protein